MARSRSKTSKNGKAIPLVPAGLRGVEDNYAAVMERTGGAALATVEKDLIDDVIAEQAKISGVSQSADDLGRLENIYQLSLWIYACVYQIASNIATVPLVAEFRRSATQKWQAQPDSEIQGMLDAPTSLLATDETIERAQTFLELTGTEVIVAQRKSGDPMDTNGPIVGLQTLRPSMTWLVPGVPFVEEYQYWVNGEVVHIDPANAQMARYVNPINDYWGLPPMSSLGTTLAVDKGIEEFNRASLEQGGTPDVVLETEKDLGRGNSKRYRLMFEQAYIGPKRRSGVVVLDNGMKLKPVGLPPKDMQFLDTARITKQRVLAAFGVTPVMVMDFSDASVLANADVQRKLFYEQTLTNKSRKLERAITRLLQGTYGPYWRARFAFDRVAVLKDMDKLRKAALDDYEGGVITQNEARAQQGLDPVDGGDDFKQPAPIVLPGGGGPPDNFPPKPKRIQATSEFKALARARYKSAVNQWLPKLRTSFRKFFREQRDRTIANFKALPFDDRGLFAPPIHEAAAAGEAITKDARSTTALFSIFDTAKEAELMLAQVGPVFLLGLLDSANSKIEQLAPSSKLALNDSHWGIRTFYAGWGATRVVDINETTRQAIKDAIEYGFEHGYSGREMEQAITAKFDELVRSGDADPDLRSEFPEYRLERIARTETGVMLNAGAMEGSKALQAEGATIVKSWLSARDNLVRDTHAQIDDETSDDPIPLAQAFSNGLQFPLDPAGEGGEVINCRCSLIEQVINEQVPTEEV